jgi:hypothetical protein
VKQRGPSGPLSIISLKPGGITNQESKAKRKGEPEKDE